MSDGTAAGSISLTEHPMPVSTVLKRERLWQVIDSCRRNAPAVWISGPPGSGKTHLVTSYLEKHKVPSLWYQFERGDDDPATFFHYLSRTFYQSFGKETAQLPEFTASQSNIEVYARRFFETLFQGTGDQLVLVFDQFHELSDDSVLHELLKRAIREVNKQSSVIVISRSDPPPALVRLYINKQMQKIGWQELRLSDDEAEALTSGSGLAVPKHQLQQWQERLQGWCAGFILMLQHVHGRDLPITLDISNSDVLLNYFAGEILASRSVTEVDFLFRTSFLPVMTPELAREISANDQAATILARLHANHAFTERRSLEGPTYQFHPLFRKFLRGRLEEFYDKESLREIKRKAALVLLNNGFIEHAAKLLFEIQDWDRLQSVVCAHTMPLIVAGRGRTVAQWFDRLQDEVFSSHPWFLYWLGRAQLSYDPELARQQFERAYRTFTDSGADPDGRWSSWAGIVQTFLHEWRDFSQLDHWIDEVDFGPSQIPGNLQPSTQVGLIVNVFSAYVYRRPNHKDLPMWESAVHKILRTNIDINQRIMIGNQLVLFYTWTGQHPKITVIMETMRGDVAPDRIAPLNYIVWKSMEAMHAWLVLDTDRAASAVQAGLDWADQTGVRVWDFMLFGQMCYAHLIAGKLADAEKYLDKMSRSVNTCRYLDSAHYHYLGAWYSLLKNDIPTAFEKARLALEFARESGSPIPAGLAAAGLAQVAFEQKDFALAEELLASVEEAGRQFNSNHFQHHCMVLRAYFDLSRGKPSSALGAIQQALNFSKEKGYWPLTWWRPQLMSVVCSFALENGVEFADQIIKQYKIAVNERLNHKEQTTWPLRISTLGRFSIEQVDTGTSLTKSVKGKPLELLQTLLAKGGKEVPAKSITDVLWPDSDGDMAHNSFNTTLHRLRKLLGNEKALTLAGGTLSLNEQICWFDVWHFDKLVDQINWGINNNDDVNNETLRALAKQLFEIYNGSFLANYTDTIGGMVREKERGRFLRTIEKLGGWWVSRGEFDQAIKCFKRALEREHLVEAFYQHLMVLYGETGRKADLEELFLNSKQVFEQHLATTPSKKTLSIYQNALKRL